MYLSKNSVDFANLLIELSLRENAIRNKSIYYIPKALFYQYIDIQLTHAVQNG